MRLPTDQQRLLVIGRNGSGKTRAAVWHLAQQDFDAPWIVLNHKNEELIDSIKGAHHIAVGEKLPKHGGLYVTHPLPETDDAATTDLMWRMYKKGNVGLYIDEGYMINPRDPAFMALMTQGRSKHIPAIVLSQRPTKISRFAVSEADFYRIFHLTDARDRDTVGAFLPLNLDDFMEAPLGEPIALPEYHSVYYDVKRNKVEILAPVPDDGEMLNVLEDKLAPKNGKRYFL